MRTIPILLSMLAAAAAQTTETRPLINVTSLGKAVARPDVAVVFLSARSSAPLAADALDQNNKKIQEIQTKLAGLGYKPDHIKLSANRFSPSGGGMYYGPGRERPTGFDVYSNIYIYLDGPELKDIAAFNSKVGLLLDELSKVGAAPVNMPISSYSMGGTSIVAFSLKDAAAFEKQAFAEALDRARPIAEDIARRMKVQITGVDSVSSFGNQRAGMIVGGPANPLDELPFEYFSSSIDEVPVRVRLDVHYSYK